MQSGQKQVVLGKGEKERRERRKEKRKRKKNKGRKNEKKREKKKRKKKGVAEANRNQKAKKKKKRKKNKTGGWYLPILCTLSPLTSPGTCPSSWSSGGGACCVDFQVLALGGTALPLPGAGLSGGCLPREAAGGTAPVAGPALETWIQLRQELRLQGLEAPGRGR